MIHDQGAEFVNKKLAQKKLFGRRKNKRCFFKANSRRVLRGIGDKKRLRMSQAQTTKKGNTGRILDWKAATQQYAFFAAI